MNKSFYNKNLHEIVRKVFSFMKITEFTDGLKVEDIVDDAWISISIGSNSSRFEGLEEYRYLTLSIFFDIEIDPDTKHGYKMTGKTDGFTLWGYVKGDMSDFEPDDFTHFYVNNDGKEELENFFRDHLTLPEAETAISKFSNRVNTLFKTTSS